MINKKLNNESGGEDIPDPEYLDEPLEGDLSYPMEKGGKPENGKQKSD